MGHYECRSCGQRYDYCVCNKEEKNESEMSFIDEVIKRAAQKMTNETDVTQVSNCKKCGGQPVLFKMKYYNPPLCFHRKSEVSPEEKERRTTYSYAYICNCDKLPKKTKEEIAVEKAIKEWEKTNG